MMISRLDARLAAGGRFTKPFDRIYGGNDTLRVNIFMLDVEVTQVSPYWDAGFPFLHPHMQWPSLFARRGREAAAAAAMQEAGH